MYTNARLKQTVKNNKGYKSKLLITKKPFYKYGLISKQDVIFDPEGLTLYDFVKMFFQNGFNQRMTVFLRNDNSIRAQQCGNARSMIDFYYLLKTYYPNNS